MRRGLKWMVWGACAAGMRAQTPAGSPSATTVPTVQQTVTVSADRGLVGVSDSATSVAVLS
jgi:hypothetical protein